MATRLKAAFLLIFSIPPFRKGAKFIRKVSLLPEGANRGNA
jgi:hypothetical protein